MKSSDIETVLIDKKEQVILEKLIQLYLHDISLYFPLPFNSSTGIYEYDDLTKYFNNSEHYPYFIKNYNNILGFILVDKNDDEYVIKEMFVLNNYKGKGIGKNTVFNILDKYKGNWIIKSLPKSINAENFWNNTINEYTNNNFKIEHVGAYNRAVFTFSNN